MHSLCRRLIVVVVLPCTLLIARPASSQPVSVRFNEGLVHGFLKLSAVDGTRLADGDLSQTASGNRVTSRLVFHFKDGSLQSEAAVFTQQKQFSFVSYRLIQKGPSFPRPLQMTIEGGMATVEYTDEHGAQKTESERIEAPSALVNGMILTLLKNTRPDSVPKQWSMIAAAPKPTLITLKLAPSGEEAFSTGMTSRKAMHYVLKVDLGGIRGVLAGLLGKQPPDSHVWILEGAAPAFVKSEQPFFPGGPLWRIELTSPVWR